MSYASLPRGASLAAPALAFGRSAGYAPSLLAYNAVLLSSLLLLLPNSPTLRRPEEKRELNHGEEKVAAKPPPKKRMDKLDTVFSCPFCNHGSSVECRIDMKNLIGEANCRICQENFSTTVNGMFNLLR